MSNASEREKSEFDFNLPKNFIGAGTFGKVFKAWDTHQGKLVAIKRIKFSNQSQMDSFQKEKDNYSDLLLKRLSHENIMPYYGYFLDNERKQLCIVMKYCEKGSLRERITKFKKQRRRFTYHNILQWSKEIMGVMDYLEKKCIVHNDHKPENLMIIQNAKDPPEESLLLTDFGEAIVNRPFQSNPRTNAGTTCYMPPERLKTDPSTPNHKTDIWACGVIFYELVHLRLPFKDQEEILQANRNYLIFDEGPLYLDVYSRMFYSFMKEIILEILEPNQTDRPSAKKIENKIESWQKKKAPKLVIDSRQFYSRHSHPITPRLNQTPIAASVQITNLHHDRYVRSLVILNDQRLASGTEDGSITIWDPDNGKIVKKLEKHTGVVTSLAVLDDDYLASGAIDKLVKVWKMKTRKLVKSLEGHDNGVTSLAVVKNGFLASGSSDKSIMIWNTETGKRTNTLTGHIGPVTSLVVLPNGYLASGSSDKTIKIWNTEAGHVIKTLTGHSGSVTSLAMLPNGCLANGSKDSFINIWNLETDECQRLTNTESESDRLSNSVNALVALGDGNLVSSNNLSIKIWNTQTGKNTKVLSGHYSAITSLAVFRNGQLASGSRDGFVKIWNLV